MLKGYWINGIIGGVGYEKSSNYIYSGCFIYDKKNGYGTQIWRDKAKYEGEWKDNHFNGYGIYYFPDGKKYIGEWENSCKNGFGEFYLIDGRKYVGYYKNDKKEGFGIYYLNENNFSINFWKNGKKHGLGKSIKGNIVNYQKWEQNTLIEKDIDEIQFLERFDDTIINYQYMFKLNSKEILKFLDIKE